MLLWTMTEKNKIINFWGKNRVHPPPEGEILATAMSINNTRQLHQQLILYSTIR